MPSYSNEYMKWEANAIKINERITKRPASNAWQRPNYWPNCDSVFNKWYWLDQSVLFLFMLVCVCIKREWNRMTWTVSSEPNKPNCNSIDATECAFYTGFQYKVIWNWWWRLVEMYLIYLCEQIIYLSWFIFHQYIEDKCPISKNSEFLELISSRFTKASYQNRAKTNKTRFSKKLGVKDVTQSFSLHIYK